MLNSDGPALQDAVANLPRTKARWRIVAGPCHVAVEYPHATSESPVIRRVVGRTNETFIYGSVLDAMCLFARPLKSSVANRAGVGIRSGGP